MLEALISEGGIFKKIMDSIKELVTDANFDCSSTGITLQAMDSSHVSLVALSLKSDGFDHFRADRTTSLGINLASLSKVLKCAGNDDAITLKAEDSPDHISFMFESKKQTRISHFNLKLIDIDSEHLGIPETEYKTIIKMPSAEFQRIVRELQTIGDTVNISATKEGVKFAVNGDSGSGTIVCKQGTASDEKEEESVQIKMEEEVSLTFAVRYLNSFAKATPLSSVVTLKMSADVPLVVEYAISNTEEKEMGHIRFYLAPKIEEEGADAAAAGNTEVKEKAAPASSAPSVKAEDD
jgi:proliferating cell nuclear antigen